MTREFRSTVDLFGGLYSYTFIVCYYPTLTSVTLFSFFKNLPFSDFSVFYRLLLVCISLVLLLLPLLNLFPDILMLF